MRVKLFTTCFTEREGGKEYFSACIFWTIVTGKHLEKKVLFDGLDFFASDDDRQMCQSTKNTAKSWN